MNTVIENTSLEELIREYFTDQVRQQRGTAIDIRRAQQLPVLRMLAEQFIQKKSDLKNFRDQLQSTLTRNEDLWGTKGPGFMMELNKLRKHHDEHDPIAENELRIILTGIDRDNLGERIERFYNFLLTERRRLHQEGKTSFQAMAPGNSAFMLSLFAYWLNSERPPVIYFPKSCMVVYLLMSAGLLTDPGNLHTVYDATNKTKTILVRNNSEHLAFQLAIDPLLHASTAFLNKPGAVEHFLSWMANRVINTNDDPPPNLIQEINTSGTLIKPASDTPIIKEGPSSYDTPGQQAEGESQHETAQFKNEKLKAVPEPLLTQLISEVQRFILVDEAVVRQIYHALLAGHVILTGPPGTGKTELASIIPEILWKSEVPTDDNTATETNELTTATAYATNLVTATDEWSVRTLISGIAPQSKDGNVTYSIQYGFLTNAIRKNWSMQSDDPHDWSLNLQRTPIQASSKIERGSLLPFRGQWLVIDEFNRAPIDLALGDALTALGGNDVLRVAIEGGSAELPIPQDFRIIGTLNSFDRSYLNQISEALKRRFSFVEILPPTRAQREAEQGIVLFKALSRVSHLSDAIEIGENIIYWGDISVGTEEEDGRYGIAWPDEQTPFREAFDFAWRTFEVIRIYRQLGTAQAITFLQHMLIAGILQGYSTREDWIAKAVDAALCTTLADQLQVLLPDEIEALLLYLTCERDAFSTAYNALLARLADRQHRVYGQLLALGSVSAEEGQPILGDERIEQIAGQESPTVPEAMLSALFHLKQPFYKLPQFTRRLRTFKAERGL